MKKQTNKQTKNDTAEIDESKVIYEMFHIFNCGFEIK